MVSIIPTTMDITYCEGARLLQDSQADLDAILVQRPNGNLTCKHCYLVIADADPDADNLRTMSSDKDWPLVVSCHVQACASLHDRRAAYSCYACLERGKTSIETSVAALKSHLQSCHLIKELQPTMPYQRHSSESESIKEAQARAPSIPVRPKRRSRPAPGVEATPERQTAGDAETVQSATSRRPVPSNPFWSGQTAASPVAPNSPSTPIKQGPTDSERPVQSRSRREIPTQAERTYTPSTAARPEQLNAVNRPYAEGADVFSVPGGFPPHEAGSHDPRNPFFQEFPPMPPPRATFSNDHSTAPIRRKDVRLEPSAQPFPEPGREDRSFPTRPSRAPPAPPVLSAPAPGPNSRAAQPIQVDVPQSPHADHAKIQQLAALGISRARAEYLLNQTGGDVNEAAVLGFEEQQGSMDGGGGEWLPTPSSQAAQTEGLPSSPSSDRRNRRSR
ncbi:uncharacterized protein Z520_01837 [Fonsecaea multimorphosa CBS 102226]|uniref:UBA domain-containing protein n=1 Tax=Fonsecaea multimorphosa CBS 102226 TaxID=1442371 RepID=A0A0D2KXX9_9EURO|nr:uncharacterized protein Z520_01837 [Fonsecaea multimorphosa CBS 102226]KIY01699.1 hypothetical protein Z520_01837 [Fonsecaea multimorphosa CBS 102226]OAL29894.1 hypothetical protein AYO22_01800 [Fonsecaea multimorphosa]